MNKINVENYVLAGCDPIPSNEVFKMSPIGPLLLTLIGGIFPAIALKGYYLLILLFLILFNIIEIVICYVTISQHCIVSHKSCLSLKSISALSWIIELSLLEVMYFYMFNGFHVSLFLLFVPSILTPLTMGTVFHVKVKKTVTYSTKGNLKYGFVPVTFWGGCVLAMLGRNFAKLFFDDISQATAIKVVLICMSLLSSIMSIGLLNIQRLYYMKKYNITLDAKKE